MKKLLSLVLSLALLFSLVSLSFAAVTIGGNFRAWYQMTNDESRADEYDNSFRFDRVALTFASEASAVNGFKGEVQFRQVRNDANPDATKVKYGTDLRIDSAYVYQKAIFAETDELDFGYINQLPFENNAYKAALVTSLADQFIGSTNSVGLKYAMSISPVDFAIALTNNHSLYNTNKNTVDGYNYGLRVGVTPMAGLKVGLAYAMLQSTEDPDANTVATVIDSNYSVGPFGAFLEYLTVTPTNNDGKEDDSLSGIYAEGSYQISNPLAVFVGRGIQVTDRKDGDLITGLGANFTTAQKYLLNNDWTVVGCKFALAPNTTLQSEYYIFDSSDDSSKWTFATRIRYDF